MTTFTEDDQKQLDDLTYRKAIVDWTAREATRQANLAALAGLAAVFTRPAIESIVSAAASAVAASDEEDVATSRERLNSIDPTLVETLNNINVVLGFAGMQVVALIERLSTPEPEPVADRGNA